MQYCFSTNQVYLYYNTLMRKTSLFLFDLLIHLFAFEGILYSLFDTLSIHIKNITYNFHVLNFYKIHWVLQLSPNYWTKCICFLVVCYFFFLLISNNLINIQLYKVWFSEDQLFDDLLNVAISPPHLQIGDKFYF